MERLSIDDKWSILYDPNDNDSPKSVCRYDVKVGPFEGNNMVFSMFYRILEDSRSSGVGE